MRTTTLFAGLITGVAIGNYLYKKARAHKFDIAPITDFDLEKYLGKWYEVARLDNRYERNLNNTTAQYSLNADGSVRVINSGYNYIKHEKTQAVGKARYKGPADEGALEVSFFGPFYADYTIVSIDKNYKHALVAGSTLDYLWFLSRDPYLPDDVLDKYIGISHELGYDVSNLNMVAHDHLTDHRGESLLDKTINKLF